MLFSWIHFTPLCRTAVILDRLIMPAGVACTARTQSMRSSIDFAAGIVGECLLEINIERNTSEFVATSSRAFPQSKTRS